MITLIDHQFTHGVRIGWICIGLMFRGAVSIQQNNLDLVLAKILIKERENSAQLADCGIYYFERGLCCPVYGGKQTSVLRNGCKVLEKKNNQILKKVRFYK